MTRSGYSMPSLGRGRGRRIGPSYQEREAARKRKQAASWEAQKAAVRRRYEKEKTDA